MLTFTPNGNSNGRVLPIPTQVFQLQQQPTSNQLTVPSCNTNVLVSPTSQASLLNGFTTQPTIPLLPTVPQIPQTSHQPFTTE